MKVLVPRERERALIEPGEQSVSRQESFLGISSSKKKKQRQETIVAAFLSRGLMRVMRAAKRNETETESTEVGLGPGGLGLGRKKPEFSF
jgi:hypothetical protein